MKTITFALITVSAFLITACSQKSDNTNTVNAILGDVSYQLAFGENPTTSTNENLRISTHLNYVLDRLKNADVSERSAAQLESRLQLITHLEEYIKGEKFPKNFDYPGERKPCFIDKNGNICAVGYLIEQTAGRDVAEYINAKYQYENILNMHDPIINEWVANSGLSLQECAMIQPMYGFGLSRQDNSLFYVLGTTNTIMTVTNGVQLINKSNNRFSPAVGMVTGTGQIVYGIALMPARLNDPNTRESYNRKLGHALLNVGIGTTTLALSTFNLLDNKKINARNNLSINLQAVPVYNQAPVQSLTIKKTF